MNRLVLIDGNAILHRAYHALPRLTTPEGTIVNAVYGFVSMLIKVWNDFKPTHVAVAFDRPEPTFRKSMYTAYQAARPRMADDLVAQVALVHDVVAAFGIPIFEAAGFEADDVIGTLAAKVKGKRQTEKGGMDEIIIVTGDRDLLQLVDDRVKVFMPTKGLSEGKLYGEAEVVEKFGVSPKQIPDLKALTGDASDNYPGVPGIGPKTAVKLLAGYGSVEKLLEAKKIGDGAAARLGLKLATIRTDAPIAVGELPVITTLDTPAARAKLESLHFPSLIKRLERPASDALTTETRPRNVGQSKKEKKKTASGQQELF